MPAEPTGPISAGTSADGSATGVPQGDIGFLDAAGSFFSALITDAPAAAFLGGLVILAIVAALARGVYLYYSASQNATQATSVVDQNRDANSDDTLRSLRETGQANANNQPINGSSRYSMIVGTWQGQWCGLDTATLNLSVSGGSLIGTVTARELKMNQDVTSCAALEPTFTGEAQQFPVASPEFDGHILSFSVQSQQMQLQLSGNQLIGPSSGANADPTIYRKIR
jgi:hypothetical protein